VGFAFIATSTTAQMAQPPAAKPEMNESCPGLIARNRPRATPASLRLALNADQIRVNYIGHSTFLIESPQGVRIATDYNDYVRPTVLPILRWYRASRSTDIALDEILVAARFRARLRRGACP
jgi:hypothetical protein